MDLPALGDLMAAAYRGTIDDEGETPEDARRELEKVFEGAYGDPIPEACLAFREAGRLLGAILVCVNPGRAPLVLFVMTAPDAKGRGIATRLLAAALVALTRSGYAHLRALITDGNLPSEALFRRHGFLRTEVRPGEAL